MPQFELLMILTLLPLQMSLGGSKPREHRVVDRWECGLLDLLLGQTIGLTS